MSPLVRKEIRLIFPFWGVAFLLAVAPVWILPIDPSWRLHEGIYWAFAFGVMLLGLAPFGQEFSLGTFSSLLAQPRERRRIWRTKMLVVLAAVAIVFGAFLISDNARFESSLRLVHNLTLNQKNLGSKTYFNSANYEIISREDALVGLWEAASIGLLLLVVAVTGGFWTTLLFRQTGAALWFAILIPGVLLIIVQTVAHSIFPEVQNGPLIAAFILYSVAGFLWARRMFVRAQDCQWLGENVSLLSFSSARAEADSTKPARKRPIRVLVRREFQSHQISLIVAFGLLVLHVCTLVYRGVHSLPQSSEKRFAFEAVPFLWLLVPWVTGCVAVAEERKQGTWESMSCLPIARVVQFAIKLFVVLLLGVLLGALVPCLIEGLGGLAGVRSEIIKSLAPADVGIYFVTVSELVRVALVIAMISFFASTLTRNTLQALGATVLIGAGVFAYFQWLSYRTYFNLEPVWAESFIVTSAPVLIVTVVWLSFLNFKTLHVGRKIWLQNILILVVVLFLNRIGTSWYVFNKFYGYHFF